MPDDTRISPAVESMKKEQAKQRELGQKGELEKALEDTFPASDPVSAITSTAAGGAPVISQAMDKKQKRDASAEASRTSKDLLLAEAPLVDEALEAIETREAGNSSVWAHEELRAMRTEVARMQETLLEVTSASGRLAKAGVSSLRQNVEARVRDRPFSSVGLAALLGYLWGITR
ncbi:hypothetical protein [Neorhizobium alkalisoli]|uniref:hypothetical protein n=1 Tax=Neorhizobium alkalisoli TaxID=528178 RepID=UPI000CFA443C|nr:hypothetical protein [Neorhizobium alkalisoli]